MQKMSDMEKLMVKAQRQESAWRIGGLGVGQSHQVQGS